MFAAEGDPNGGEGGGFGDSFEGEKGSGVVGDVAGEFFDGVIGGEDGKDCVGGEERRFFDGIGGGDEDVDGGKIGFCGGI